MSKSSYRCAIVTGASSGIGKSIALELNNRKVKVYALARNMSQLHVIQQSLPPNLQSLYEPVECDVSDIDSVEAAVSKICQSENVDLVINNAGIGHSRNFVDISDEETAQTLATNIGGVINVTRSILKLSNIDQDIQIVNVTSLAGKIGFPDLSVYSASKFAIEGLTEALRLEYNDSNVVFTVLRPGITDTAFFDKAGMQGYREGVDKLNSYYSSEKVAQLFLDKLTRGKRVIIIGNDKLFMWLLPFIPFNSRFKVLDIINKL